jgi:adenine-specific DNA glycosylase
VKQVRETAVVIGRGGRVLVVRRGAGEWWAGLWDFPRVAGRAARADRGIAASAVLGPLGCGRPEVLGTVVHTVTHHRITLDVVRCTGRRAGRVGADARWVTPRQLAALAMSSPARRIARLVSGKTSHRAIFALRASARRN